MHIYLKLSIFKWEIVMNMYQYRCKCFPESHVDISVKDSHFQVPSLAAEQLSISRCRPLCNLCRSGFCQSSCQLKRQENQQSTVCFWWNLLCYHQRFGVLQRCSVGAFCSEIYGLSLSRGFWDSGLTHLYSFFFIFLPILSPFSAFYPLIVKRTIC